MRGWGPIGGLLIASNMQDGWLGRTELLCGEDQRRDAASDGVEAAQLAALGYCNAPMRAGRPAVGVLDAPPSARESSGKAAKGWPEADACACRA